MVKIRYIMYGFLYFLMSACSGIEWKIVPVAYFKNKVQMFLSEDVQTNKFTGIKIDAAVVRDAVLAYQNISKINIRGPGTEYNNYLFLAIDYKPGSDLHTAFEKKGYIPKSYFRVSWTDFQPITSQNIPITGKGGVSLTGVIDENLANAINWLFSNPEYVNPLLQVLHAPLIPTAPPPATDPSSAPLSPPLNIGGNVPAGKPNPQSWYDLAAYMFYDKENKQNGDDMFVYDMFTRGQESKWIMHPYNEPYYEFTNFYLTPITIDGVVWPTSEHYFQAQKFTTNAGKEHIRGMQTANDAFKAARSSTYPKIDTKPGSEWHKTKKFEVMLTAVYEKFTQNTQLKNLLLGTEPGSPIVEAARTPYQTQAPSGASSIVTPGGRTFYNMDDEWGAGADGKGKNHLGKILMKVREALRRNIPLNQLAYTKADQDLKWIDMYPAKLNTTLYTKKDGTPFTAVPSGGGPQPSPATPSSANPLITALQKFKSALVDLNGAIQGHAW